MTASGKLESFYSFFTWSLPCRCCLVLICVWLVESARKGKGVNFQDFNFFLIDWEDEQCLNKREVLLCAQNLIIFKCC